MFVLLIVLQMLKFSYYCHPRKTRRTRKRLQPQLQFRQHVQEQQQPQQRVYGMPDGSTTWAFGAIIVGKELSFPLYLWAFESGEVQWRYKKPFLRVFWLENGLSMTLCEVQKHSLHVMCMKAAL